MSRAKHANVAQDAAGNVLVAPTITLYEETGTIDNLIAGLMDASRGGSALANPFNGNSQGEFSMYLDEPLRARMKVTHGADTEEFPVDIFPSASKFYGVFKNIKEYGAIGDGSSHPLSERFTTLAQAQVIYPHAAALTDEIDQCAFQGAVNDVITAGSGRVFVPYGSFKIKRISVANATNVCIFGPGKLVLTGTSDGATATSPGIAVGGTSTNVIIEDLFIQGDGVAANHHKGVYVVTGAVVTGLRVHNIRVENVVSGVYTGGAGLWGDGTFVAGSVTNCYLKNMVGVAAGQGYGIVVVGSHMTITGNHIESAQRHSIYVARARDSVIANNTILNHRSTLANQPHLAAMPVARSQNISVHGNTFYNCYDTCITVESDVNAGESGEGISIIGNTFRDCSADTDLVLIGGESPATTQVIRDIVFANNVIISDARPLQVIVRLNHGIRVLVTNNVFRFSNATAGASTVSAIYLSMIGETAGTATYSDEIVVSDNIVYLSGRTNHHVIEMSSRMTESIVSAQFSNNRLVSGTSMFSMGGTATNPNLVAFSQSITGLAANLNGTMGIGTLAAGSIQELYAGDSGVTELRFYQKTALRAFLKSDASANFRLDADGSIDFAPNNTVALSLTTGGLVDIKNGNTALGGGAAPTLGTIGGSGPASAAQHSWQKIKIAGVDSYVPVWR